MILRHRSAFGTPHHRCAASQCVARAFETCDDLQWSAMLLEAQNRRKTYCDGDVISSLVCSQIVSSIFQIAIIAMKIARKKESIPTWVADWPHCCDLEVPASMVCNGSKSFKIAGKCPISLHRVAGVICTNVHYLGDSMRRQKYIKTYKFRWTCSFHYDLSN